MNLRGTLYLGWRHVRRRKRVVALLTTAITLSIFLPIAILVFVQDAERHLRQRSSSTPLLLGSAGSPLELVFNGIYFSEPAIETITVGDAEVLAADGLASTIPIHARFEARGHTVVGTTLDYFGFRDLELERGRLFALLGDCVIGAAVADALDVGPGDHVVSTPTQVFDLAGVYPLKMNVTGVLKSTGQVEDDAIFVDARTTWIMEGIAHGHQDAEAADPEAVLDRDGTNTALNASVVEYTEVTSANVGSFHFHGDPATFPLTAAIVVPRDSRAATILLGRFVGERTTTQLVRPDDVVAGMFETVFEIRDLVLAALLAVGSLAVIISALVFALSNRLRQGEFESLAHLGADPMNVRALVLFEAAFVALLSIVLAGVLLALLVGTVPLILPAVMG